MAGAYFEPKSVAPILQEGLRARAPYLAQATGGIQAALPALGQLGTAAIEGDAARTKRMSVQQAQEVYANYLSKVDQGLATPEDNKYGTMAALSLGLTPPAHATVSPDIWNGIKTEAGITSTAPGTDANVKAGEALARMKGTTKAAAAAAAKEALDAKKTAADAAKVKAGDDKWWGSQFKLFTPTNASRGSLIGQAAYGNSRADRALQILNRGNGKITPQDMNKVITDLAGIMQGGSPHADAITSQGYNTLAEQWAALVTRIKGEPNAANIPEIVADLRRTVTDIKNVDSKIIQDNLDTFEQTNSGYVDRNPEKWAKIKASVMKGTQSAGAAPAGGVGGDQATSDYVRSLNLGAAQ